MKNQIAGNVNAGRNLKKYSTDQLFNALKWWSENISGHYGKYKKGRTLLGTKKYTRNGARIHRANIENDLKGYLKIR